MVTTPDAAACAPRTVPRLPCVPMNSHLQSSSVRSN
uniref:Uncharacterized protein n=1 Tax=Arundo donax TaxID=35708 RepID=A0A0A9C5R6_ARUDO